MAARSSSAAAVAAVAALATPQPQPQLQPPPSYQVHHQPQSTVVMDLGSHTIRAGWAHRCEPAVTIPSIVGVPIMTFEEEWKWLPIHGDRVTGDDCLKYASCVHSSYPMEQGIIRDWGGMEELWNRTFDKLGVDISSSSRSIDKKQQASTILLTEPVMNPKSNQVKTYATMFEKYGFDRCKLAVSPLLALYAQGMLTGVVVDTGDSMTHTVPIWDGIVMTMLTKRLPMGGRHITRQLIRYSQHAGYALHRTADYAFANQMKEVCCYIACDDETTAAATGGVDGKLASDTTVLVQEYKLPDGRTIKIGRERFLAPEVLFYPHLADIDTMGLHYHVRNVIHEVDADIRQSLMSNIVLAGGSSQLPGFGPRLESSVRTMLLDAAKYKTDPKSAARLKLRVDHVPRRKHMVYLGASVLASVMNDRASFWITKAEWAEHGEQIIAKKH